MTSSNSGLQPTLATRLQRSDAGNSAPVTQPPPHDCRAAQSAACGQRWVSGDPCIVEPDGRHVCRRGLGHRTHICQCNAIGLPTEFGLWS